MRRTVHLKIHGIQLKLMKQVIDGQNTGRDFFYQGKGGSHDKCMWSIISQGLENIAIF